MNTVRFTIGLVILLLVLLIFKFFTEPFAPGDFMLPLAEAFGVLVAGVILGLLVWSALRLFKGPDKAPDLQNFVFYMAAIFIALVIPPDFPSLILIIDMHFFSSIEYAS